jgi:hypothetical protein
MGGDCAYQINNASIVLRAEMAGTSFLFTGDANGKRRAELSPGTPAHVEAKQTRRRCDAVERRAHGEDAPRTSVRKAGRHEPDGSSESCYTAGWHVSGESTIDEVRLTKFGLPLNRPSIRQSPIVNRQFHTTAVTSV